jgi:hypothetical protein
MARLILPIILGIKHCACKIDAIILFDALN